MHAIFAKSAKFFGQHSKTITELQGFVLDLDVQGHFSYEKDISLCAWKASFSIFEWNMRTPSHNAHVVGHDAKQPTHEQKK